MAGWQRIPLDADARNRSARPTVFRRRALLAVIALLAGLVGLLAPAVVAGATTTTTISDPAGTVTISSQIETGGDNLVISGGTGVVIDASIDTEGGFIEISTQSGPVDLDATVTTEGGAITVSAAGAVTIGDPMTSGGDGPIAISSQSGDVGIGPDAPITAGDGTLAITATGGLATIQSESALTGSTVAVSGGTGVDLDSEVQSSGSTAVTAATGKIDLDGASIHAQSTLTMTASGSLMASNDTALSAFGNALITAGAISLDGSSITSSTGYVSMTAENGPLSVGPDSALAGGQAVSLTGAPVDLVDDTAVSSNTSVSITSVGTSAGGIASGSQVSVPGDDLNGFEEIVVTGEGGDMASCADPATGANTVTSDDMDVALGQAVPIAAAASGSEACNLSFSDSQPVVVPSTITNVPTSAIYGDDFVANVTSPAAGTTSVVSSSPTVCTVESDGLTVDDVGAGECLLVPQVQAAPGDTPEPGTAASFMVSPADQSITLTSTVPTDATYGGMYSVAATSTSGLAVSFSPAPMSVCTVSGYTVTFTGVGTCTIDANQSGDNNYNRATQATQGFTVNKAPTTVVAAPVSALDSLLTVKVTFSATVTSQTTGQALDGQTVTFADGSWATCSATTTTNGVATCSVSVLAVVALLLSPSYNASYAGGTDYDASSTAGKITLL